MDFLEFGINYEAQLGLQFFTSSFGSDMLASFTGFQFQSTDTFGSILV